MYVRWLSLGLVGLLGVSFVYVESVAHAQDAAIPAVAISAPWDSMNLPTSSGVVSLADSSSLIVMYDAAQVVAELDSNWSKALATAGWVVTPGEKPAKEGKPITRNFTRETTAMTYILTPATRKSPAVSVVLATAGP